jgi:hypothetical protein
MNAIPTKCYHRVALLDEHELKSETGSVELVVDLPFLEAVAARNNERYASTGDATPVVLGHTRDGVDEKDQPEVVGFAMNFRVEPFTVYSGPSSGLFDEVPKYAIYADLYIYTDRAEEVERQYPRRSVELWVRRKEIDPISLLGATTPERDLGPLVKFSRGSDSVYRYSLSPKGSPSPMPPETNPAMTSPDAAAESAPFQALVARFGKLEAVVQKIADVLEQVMQAEEAEGTPKDEDADDLLGPDEEAEGNEEVELTDDEDFPVEDEVAEEDEAEEEEGKDKESARRHNPPPVKMDAMAGPATGYVPGLVKRPYSRSTPTPTPTPKATVKTPTPAPTPNKTPTMTPEHLKFQRQLDKVTKENAELRLKYARAEATKIVDGLVTEGYELADRDEEVNILVELGHESADGKAYVEKIKRNYRRSISPASEEVMELARYAREEGGDMVSLDMARKAADLVSRKKAPTLAEAYKTLRK